MSGTSTTSGPTDGRRNCSRCRATQANIDATRTADGKRLYFQGIEPDIDGGVDVVDLETGERATVVLGGPTPGKSRRGLFWSTSGKTLFSGLCGFYVCRMDVIDGATGVARRLPKPFGAIAASDRYSLGYESADGPDRPWAIYDLETDELTTVTKKWIATTEEGVSVGGDRFAVAGFTANHETYNIVLVNARTGNSRLVHSESSGNIEVARLRRCLTGSRWVILSAGMPWDLLRDGGGRVDVLDIETGEVIRSVAVVGP